MKVLRIQPKKYPEVIEIDGSLESLQKEVAGPIQVAYPWDDPVALICNEEGKLIGINFNRALMDAYGTPTDVIDGTFLISGTFLIVGLTEDDFGDLSQEYIDKYEKLFHQPEKFWHEIDERGRTHLKIDCCDPEE